MASLYLTWDNSTISGNPNAINQRVSWRRTSVGGSYFTTGLSPANDMSTAISAAEHTTAIENQVFEYKVEALCTTGGPTANLNGNQEGIVFLCILPTLSSDLTSITVNIDLTATDITKARLILKKSDDNSTVSTVTVNKVADNIDHVFTSLTSFESFYLTVEFYADVNGVEVVSSSVDYLNAVCGGNIAGYQVNTGGDGNITFQSVSSGNTMDGVSVDTWFALVEPFPVINIDSIVGNHNGYTGALTVNATVGGNSRVEIYVNAALTYCIGVAATGAQSYAFPSVTFAGSDTILIILTAGSVCP